jgi:Tfp pilus assembly protein PilV
MLTTRPPNSRARRGFTLIEALAASVVLAFVVLGVCGMIVSAVANTRASGELIEINQAAQASMETLASRPLDDISPGVGVLQSETVDASLLSTPANPQVTVEGHIQYLHRYAAQPSRDLALIAVTATMPDGQSVTVYRLAARSEMP